MERFLPCDRMLTLVRFLLNSSAPPTRLRGNRLDARAFPEYLLYGIGIGAHIAHFGRTRCFNYPSDFLRFPPASAW